MIQLTDEGHRIVNDIASRHGFSPEAVTVMLAAVANGHGSQAQFNHSEFGGMGQWSSGGMTMIGDMFNNYLKGRVDQLCAELSRVVQNNPGFARPAQSQSQSQGGGMTGGSFQFQGGGGGQFQSGVDPLQGGGGRETSIFVAGGQTGNWWPEALGSPASTGGQNNMRYAYFPDARRLALDLGGTVTVHDTGEHRIGGFSQQQSGDQSITLTSQFGVVRIADLPIVSGVEIASSISPEAKAEAAAQPTQKEPDPSDPLPVPVSTTGATTPAPPPPQPEPLPPVGHADTSTQVLALVEKLAELHKNGILTDDEFQTKKSELLSRL